MSKPNLPSVGGKVLLVFGTRPEAIKLAPVIEALRGRVDLRVCVTAQHRTMLDQVLSVFRIVPDIDLDLMKPDQDLYELTAAATRALKPVMQSERPQLVVVQGDTTTTFAAALAAFYAQIAVAHVEAGLRTYDKRRPFPEEINRRLTTALADWHFAPTPWARANLLREGVQEERIFVTGNTGVDALLGVARRLDRGELAAGLPEELIHRLTGSKVVLVTGHRRESFGEGFERICRALRELVEREPEVVVVYPVHLNPHVREPVFRWLGNHPRIVLLEPLEYVPFVALMRRADVILTDSGGIQEEAPSLPKPVLVMREKTERPEGVEAGVARLVGTDPQQIVASVQDLLHDAAAYGAMTARRNPYGDGHAAARIAHLIEQILSGVPTPVLKG
ncbi:MAG: UDP-N-acetylglucosamine 2-epimerase (non-hydrolyzing) [Candidatus Binatia bacterium]|nr:UDP-N-acetylglucosamine 2-epimerase (non-hydrolyzing) [Candidatus Binatia bacterium]